MLRRTCEFNCDFPAGAQQTQAQAQELSLKLSGMPPEELISILQNFGAGKDVGSGKDAMPSEPVETQPALPSISDREFDEAWLLLRKLHA